MLEKQNNYPKKKIVLVFMSVYYGQLVLKKNTSVRII